MTTVPNTTDTAELASTRTILSLIALAEHLPVPKGIKFLPDNTPPILALDAHTLVDGERWLRWLGATPTRYLHTDGFTYLESGRCIDWQGWRVQVHVAERLSSPTGQLDDDTRTQLAALATAGRES